MKRQKTSKSAFSLIEMLIVIGIIGVLSAVMLGLMGGSSNAARATQCMTNMRGLAVAVLNYAMQNEDGNFPVAGSFKWTNHEAHRNSRYPTRGGWISWDKGADSKTQSCPSYIMFNESSQERLRYALTNGCIWATGGMSEKTYQCPVHDEACLKANKRHPGWSYVMNETFYWNEPGKAFPRWRGQSHGNIYVCANDSQTPSKLVQPSMVARSPEKVLLFAEIQGLDDEKRGLRANTGDGGNKGDCVLQYQNEVMGFNHVQSGGTLAGHVAFADGHVEKFIYPSSGDAKQLTRWLCTGQEVSFNGSNYQSLK